MRKAFITGGAGSVGSQLAKSLVDRGWQVTVVDDLSDGKIENLADKVSFRSVPPALTEQFLSTASLKQDQVLLITGDFVEPAVVYHLQNHGYTHVFHLAGKHDAEYCQKYPATTTNTNLQKSVELFSASKQIDLKQFIFLSGFDTYQELNFLNIQYFCAETLLTCFQNLFGLKTTVVNYEQNSSAETVVDNILKAVD